MGVFKRILDVLRKDGVFDETLNGFEVIDSYPQYFVIQDMESLKYFKVNDVTTEITEVKPRYIQCVDWERV